MNQLYDTDNANKAGRVKRKKGINNDNPLVNEVMRATNVQDLLCPPDQQNLVRLPTLRELPIESVVPDLVAVHTVDDKYINVNMIKYIEKILENAKGPIRRVREPVQNLY